MSVALLGGTFTTANAQGNDSLMLAPMDIFVPHWQVGVQGGVGYDLGEAKFGQLLSPTAQVTVGYHFNEFLSVRAAVSGWVSRNRYVFPEVKYKWNFVQPTIEAKLDLSSLFLGWVPENTFRPYAFLGGGLNLSFSNGDANKAHNEIWGVEFEKLWDGTRFNPVIRGGIGFDWWFTEFIGLTGEANANLLPDHYNSKLGKNDNRDWRFNAMLGLQFRLGDYNRRSEAVYAERAAQRAVQPAPRKISRAETDLTVNIQFVINQSIIRPTEFDKLQELISYLNEHPESHVLLTGYADKETGNPTINERLSRERADAVAAYLRARGINSHRIHTDHKGDRIQPFDFPPQNRVCVCIVLNPKYL